MKIASPDNYLFMKNPTIKNSIIAYLGHEDSPDISNPIHSTEVAQAYGFKGPLVGGVTVWGWATETLSLIHISEPTRPY